VSGPDHRPWLILSRREAEALRSAVMVGPAPSQDLMRALRQIKLQVDWIASGGQEGWGSSVGDALIRERESHA